LLSSVLIKWHIRSTASLLSGGPSGSIWVSVLTVHRGSSGRPHCSECDPTCQETNRFTYSRGAEAGSGDHIDNWPSGAHTGDCVYLGVAAYKCQASPRTRARIWYCIELSPHAASKMGHAGSSATPGGAAASASAARSICISEDISTGVIKGIAVDHGQTC
jgi:hypothetical protein